jgi:hypothetical protein
MSKSTPISQLPSNVAVSNNGDNLGLMLDDDNAVNDALSQFDVANNAMMQQNMQHQQQPQVMMSQQPMMPPQQMMMQSQHGGMQAYENMNNMVLPNPQLNMMMMSQNKPSSWMNFDKDLKTVALVVVLCFIVQVIPIEQYVYKYVPVENIPYSNFIVKAVLAGTLFFLARQYVL